MRRSDHVDLGIRAHRLDKTVEKAGFNQRFVSLDVENQIKPPAFTDNLSDSIRPALMTLRGHRDLGAPIEGRPGNAHIIGGDDDGIQILRATTAFPNMTEKRLVTNEMQRFSRKTRRTPARRNNTCRFNSS